MTYTCYVDPEEGDQFSNCAGDAIQEYLEPDVGERPLPAAITLYTYPIKQVEESFFKHAAETALENFSEHWSEEYGDCENGPREELPPAILDLLTVALRQWTEINGGPKQIELHPSAQETIDVKQWIADNQPEWLEKVTFE